MYIKVENENIIGIYADNIEEGLIEIDSIPEPEQKEGYIPIRYYRDGQIVYEYEKIPEMPEEEPLIPEIPYEKQVQNKIHQVYSLDDENAILRKEIARLGNTSEEFNAYNAYVEQCKKEVKERINK